MLSNKILHNLPMVKTKRAVCIVTVIGMLTLPPPLVEGGDVTVMVGFGVCVSDTTSVVRGERVGEMVEVWDMLSG